jgi:hypothetical protein
MLPWILDKGGTITSAFSAPLDFWSPVSHTLGYCIILSATIGSVVQLCTTYPLALRISVAFLVLNSSFYGLTYASGEISDCEVIVATAHFWLFSFYGLIEFGFCFVSRRFYRRLN